MLGDAGDPVPEAPGRAGSALVGAGAGAGWVVVMGSLGGCGLVLIVVGGGGGVAFLWFGFIYRPSGLGVPSLADCLAAVREAPKS